MAVRHITPERLDELEPMLAQLRELDGLTERKRGVFYRKSSAFLHFHEDPAGLFADCKLTGEFDRFRVSTEREQQDLLARIESALG